MSFMLFHHPEQADEHAQHDHNYSRCSDELSTALFLAGNLPLPEICVKYIIGRKRLF